jgi:SAM-dependent methyltransferase
MTDHLTIARLREDLLAAEFTVGALTELWGEAAGAALARGHRTPALRALDSLAQPAPAATLARLFVLGLPVEAALLDSALPSAGAEGTRRLGLVSSPSADGSVKPLVDLRPYAFTDSWGEVNWWIASDLGEVALGGSLPEGHVLGVGGASLTLSGLMIDRSARSVLDLGTGCGIQAMHASRHAGRVVATDISERALEFARLNSELNAISNIEFRLGSLFDPVRGERFDHIVSNPPFVITPRRDGVPAYEYRDGGMVGDALVARVITESSQFLEPGGVAQFLGNWEYRAGADGLDRIDGLDRVAAWLDETDLDAWIVEREVQDPAEYSETWIRDGGTRSGTEFDDLMDAWLDDFDDRGVAAVGFGYITLRKPVSTGVGRLRRLERLDGAPQKSLGSHILASLQAYDWQAALDDRSLSRALLQAAPDVTEERHYWPGDEHPAVMNLKQGGGFGRVYQLDTALAAIVGACDGELSVAAICGALAELLSTDDSPIDADELLAQVLPTIREYVTVGILRPAALG